MIRRKKLVLSLILLIGCLIFVIGNVGAVEVIYKKISTPPSEPAFMIFIVIGLIGLFVRRRKFKNEK